jgi:cytochrome c oxidase subunit 3
MATLTPSLTKKRPTPRTTGGGGRPPVIDWPRGGGGGGGGRGDGDLRPSFGEKAHRYRIGVLLTLCSVTMLFVAFTSAYIVRQGVGTFDPMTGGQTTDWRPVPLPNTLLLINTGLLLLSSITLERARKATRVEAAVIPVTRMPGIAPERKRPFSWLWVTIALATAFLIGQWQAWETLRAQGLTISSTPASSFVYLMTGTHAVHLIGGLLALLYAGFSRILRRSLDSRRIVVDATALYWHFMGGLWIYIYALLYFVHG